MRSTGDESEKEIAERNIIQGLIVCSRTGVCCVRGTEEAQWQRIEKVTGQTIVLTFIREKTPRMEGQCICNDNEW